MRKWLAILLGCSLAACLGALAFRTVSWSAVLAAIRSANWAVLALVPAVLALTLVPRAARWRVVMPDVPDATLSNLIKAAGIGTAASYALPAKLGEAFGAHALGRLVDRSRFETLGVVLVSRIADLLVLFALVVAGTFVFSDVLPRAFRVTGWTVTAVSGALLVVALLGRLLLPGRWVRSLAVRVRARLGQRGLALLEKLTLGVFIFRSPGQLAAFVAYTAALWLTVAASLWLAAYAFHVPLAPQVAPIAAAIGAVGAMLPSAPGNVGTFHFFGVLALGAAGATRDEAAACILVYHALDVCTAMILGGLSLLGAQRGIWRFRPTNRGIRGRPGEAAWTAGSDSAGVAGLAVTVPGGVDGSRA